MSTRVFGSIAVFLVSLLSIAFLSAQESGPAKVPEMIYTQGYEAVKKLFQQAVVAGDLDICKELLEKNAYYVNEADQSSMTQLHYAAMSGQTELCRLLLRHGARPDIGTKRPLENYLTPLEAAIANNRTETALLLIEASAAESLKPVRGRNPAPLFLAIQNENVEIVKALLAKKAEVNTPGKAFVVTQTPLAYAAAVGNTEICNVLLQAGADPAFKQGDVRTDQSLFLAAMTRRYELCSFLVESKFDPNARNISGQTVLHVLIGERELYGVTLEPSPFKEAFSAFTVTGPYKRVTSPYATRSFEKMPKELEVEPLERPLEPKSHFAAQRFCKLFVEAGTDVNARDIFGCSVLETLFLAQIEGLRTYDDFRAILELFLAAKVDLKAADENGWTPLFYLLFYTFLDEEEEADDLKEDEIKAIAEKKIGLFKRLIAAGADVKTPDKLGNTLLHYTVSPPESSIEKGDFSVELDYDTRGNHRFFSRQLIELLIAGGASLSDENNEGETPLDWATQGSGAARRGGMGGMGGGFGSDFGGGNTPSAADMLNF